VFRKAGCRAPASLMKCGLSTRGGCWGVIDGPGRREAARASLGLGYDGLRLGVPGFLISDFNSRLVVELL
jgi:hypothetical protein